MKGVEPKRYEAYKDSEVEWLGEVPASWNIVRNKEIFEERNTLSLTGKETLLTVSHITGVTPRSEKNVNMFMAETMVGYKICEKGDLLINTMWAWMGALGTSKDRGICSPSYNVYKPRKGVSYNARYFDYLYRIPNSIVEMTRNSKGIVSSRLRLYPKEFFQIRTILPDSRTQKAIADYLEEKTAQIDRKIDLLTQKVKRYAQLKQAIINETVIHGLNKSVALKDSGVERLGEIPAHWQVKRLKDVSLIQYSNVDKEIHDDETPVKLCNYVDVYKNDFVDSSLSFMEATANFSEMKRFTLKKHDVLVTKDSETCEDIANPALVLNNLPSASSRLKLGIKAFEFRAGIIDLELPINAALFAISLSGPSLKLVLEF